MRTNAHLLLSFASFWYAALRLSPVAFCAVTTAKPAAAPLLLSCGGDGGSDDSGRKWVTDTKYLSSADKSVTATAQYQDPSLPSATPYMSARVFTDESAYKFKVEPKSRYWLRLHFYPADYSSYASGDAFFSVVAGGVTLLNNFSAAITAQALTQGYLMREYSLAPLDSDSLTVTFKPNSDTHKGAHAFVNGIELAEMPDAFDSAALVGVVDQTVDTATANLQTMFRLNVGGRYLSPVNDSLSRTWFDDSAYVFGAGFGVTYEANSSVAIQYGDGTPEYTAPEEVYRTQRSMGPDPKVNVNYNLTWLFQVDANFSYVLRLHFCEFLHPKLNQIVFDVFINNQTAEEGADVMAWATKTAVPVYRDYAVYGSGDELWVALHPSPNSKPEFYDSILNGLEIFKMSDVGKASLAGPNPVPSALLVKAEEKSRAFAPPAEESSNKKATVIGGAIGGVASLGVVAALCIAVHNKKRRKVAGTESHTSSWLPLYGHSKTSGTKSTISGKSAISTNISNEAASNSRHFTLAEIRLATKNFDESQVIGVGGFGKVYRGVVDGSTKVAIKRSNPSSEQGVNEFQTEVEMLSKLRHKHLVSLIGYCEENEEMVLVYDYMAYGTLREHLYKQHNNKPQLPWKQRLEICIGAARGLHYLHTGAKYTIIHRDVKTTNILLDEKWVAKVSDFGLSKTGPNMNQTHVSTVVKGSFGYLDPEYFRRQQLTEKSDVYSFGVVLFEVLCSRPALNPSLPKEQVSLADWALCCMRKGTLEDIIDPHLKGKIRPDCLKKFADTAQKCLSDAGTDRPSMGDVLWNLEFALQLQENPDSARSQASDDSESDGPGNLGGVGFHGNSLSSIEDGTEEASDDDPNGSDIFSQIVNPKGR